MVLSTLLGRKLKDDEVLRILRDYHVDEVIYDFDRHHESTEDVYWAAARQAGFQLRFNQDQILDTIFCYFIANEGFSPVSTRIVGAPIYTTFDEAEVSCRRISQSYSVSDSRDGPKFHKLWLCAETSERRTHYQFKDGALILVTLMLPKT